MFEDCAVGDPLLGRQLHKARRRPQQQVPHWLATARRSTLPMSLLTAAFFASACVQVERPELSDDTLPPVAASELSGESSDESVAGGSAADAGDQTSETDGDQISETDSIESQPNLGPANALITPTGVIVPVLSTDEGDYLVRTPCGNEEILAWGTPLYSAQVVLDPGHGGEIETGAIGPNGLQEKDLNLDVAKRTARILEGRGISVVLTRTSDYRIPLIIRTEIGQAVGAKLMVSIHHNAPNWLESDVPGTEIFVQTGTPESQRLGGLLWEELVDALSQFEDVQWTAADDAGALEVLNKSGDDTYGMVRRPPMPAVLAELGYLSNPSEAALFSTPRYVDVASIALADGIERWLVTDDPGSGFVAEPRLFTPTGGTGGTTGCVDPDLE